MSELQTHLYHAFSENGSRPALSVRGAEYTFNDISGYVCAYQKQSEGSHTERVAVFGDRSLSSYVGVISSFFSGQTFVPLNPAFPDVQNKNIIRLSDAKSIFFDSTGWSMVLSVLSGLEGSYALYTVDNGANDYSRMRQEAEQAGHVLNVISAEERGAIQITQNRDDADILYIMFTSGTTGTPKGVPISHGNVAHYLRSLNDLLDIGYEDRFTQLFDLTFDLSMHDIFLSWFVGGCLCVPERMEIIAPKKYIEREKITIWFSVPSVLAMMAKMRLLEVGSYPDIRYGLFCGEALPEDLVYTWMGAAPNADIINLYGPTEATIAFTQFTVDRHNGQGQRYKNGVIPIGKVFGGNKTCVVSEVDTSVVADGEQGELCLAGPQLTQGYLNNPEQNAERFFVGQRDDLRWYRTGDRVYYDEALGYVYLGRMDHQVKIRGYRVELAEIENVLRSVSGSAHVAAVAWPVDATGRAEGVVAFVVAPTINTDEMHQGCIENLVDYKRPSSIYILDALPLNANGKVDRNALMQNLTEQA